MDIASKYEAPVTFFVDVAEFQAMERAGNNIDKIAAQLSEAVASGHDAQLHLHPQWEGAKWGPDLQWHLTNEKWRIGDLDPNEILRILKAGKTWLEEVAGRKKRDYRCVAFRAGGWCIQPSKHVVSALKRLHIQVDSTVAPTIFNHSKGEWNDFRDAPELPLWRVDEDICLEGRGSLLEIPIATGKIKRTMHLKILLWKKRYKVSGLAVNCVGTYEGADVALQRVRGTLSKIARLGRVMLDFSTMPEGVLIDITRQWMQRFAGVSTALPIVAIAHTKNFTVESEAALQGYLTWARKEGLRFSTYHRWLEGGGA
jgi:hypothetical protein